MLARVQRVLAKSFPKLRFEEAVVCHHNYVAEERHFGEELLVTRKGAIRAGNPLSFESASHGAGRRMSRSQAKKSFTVADLAHQTEGVECRKDHGVIDEAPKAYKNIDRVMEQQAELVEIVAELKQVLCVKG
ncbi:MAG TPA: RtcB family protein [Polyangiaceae bacterium]|jgi:tRNA-splicing ligase RtcB|nr:RtcB family protein [Polyangiaceae bacterium]